MMPTDLFDRDDNLVPLNTEDGERIEWLLDKVGAKSVVLNGVPFTGDQWADVLALRERLQRYGPE